MTRRLFGGLGYQPSIVIDPITVSSVWAGDPMDDGFTLLIRSTDAASLTVRYSTDPGLAGYSTASATETVDDLWSVQLTGLSANTLYYYGIAGSDVTGQCHTSPVAGTATSFGIAAASCGGHSGGEYVTDDVSDAPTYLRILDRMTSGNIVGFIHMGDRHYKDYNGTSVSTRRSLYHDVMAAANQFAMHLGGWVAYMDDDHDWCGNDSDGTATGAAVALQVFREHVPWTLEESSGTRHYTFVRGRVRFIILDVRAERSPNSDTDDADKTMLGATQKQWFKDTVSAATEPVIVVVTPVEWGDNTAHDDCWANFSTERQELAEYIEDEGIGDKFVFLSGDTHSLRADDGTNTQFDPGSSNPGPLYAGLAPLDAGFTTSVATYSDGQYQESQQQYGTVHFDDNGTDITVTIRGWEVNGASESEVFEMSRVFG